LFAESRKVFRRLIASLMMITVDGTMSSIGSGGRIGSSGVRGIRSEQIVPN
jgi:hypothetical protein